MSNPWKAAAATLAAATLFSASFLDSAQAAEKSVKSTTNNAKKSAPASAGKAAKNNKKKGGGKKVVKKAQPAEVKAVASTPTDFVERRVQKVLTDLKSRPLRPPTVLSKTEVETQAAKSPFLSALYGKDMVDASWATEMLSDKLIMARVLERELGSRASIYYPKTMGLREFLSRHRLIKSDGAIVQDGDKIESALHDEFPAGFVIRPAVGVAPQETGRGMFQEGDQFIVEVLKPESPLYTPAHMRQPVKSTILDTIASGEAVVIQENVVGTADAHRKLKNRFYQEVRVHTYEGRVVEGAVPERWVQQSLLNDDQVHKAEAFVADFLKSLPLPLLNRQAWGVDVAVMDNGEMRVVDVVTNRGKRIQWSSYLEQPRVLGSYARHFETYYGMKFNGVSGSLLRNNFGNYFPYWSKRIEKARPGVGKVMAFLPPVP